MRILVVDDDPKVLRLLEASLNKGGYEVVTAVNGLEAWSRFQDKETPEIAILDWMMPGMDGIALCRKIREHFSSPPIYILMLTGMDEKDKLLTAFEA